MAAYRASWPVMQRLVPLLAKLVQDGGIDEAAFGRLKQQLEATGGSTNHPMR